MDYFDGIGFVLSRGERKQLGNKKEDLAFLVQKLLNKYFVSTSRFNINNLKLQI